MSTHLISAPMHSLQISGYDFDSRLLGEFPYSHVGVTACMTRDRGEGHTHTHACMKLRGVALHE